MFYKAGPFIEPTNHNNNNSEEYAVKSVLGAEFKDCVGGFPLINVSIEIEVGIRFHSMKIAVHFVEQYALQNNFAVFKHKSEKFPDNTAFFSNFTCKNARTNSFSVFFENLLVKMPKLTVLAFF
jgi:hypothetical protein